MKLPNAIQSCLIRTKVGFSSRTQIVVGRIELSSGDEWSKFSARFSEGDISDLMRADRALEESNNSPSLQEYVLISKNTQIHLAIVSCRSDHPDCRGGTVTGEIYRTTSRTLPIFVTSGGGDQTQLIIKRVLLLRKLSKVMNSESE